MNANEIMTLGLGCIPTLQVVSSAFDFDSNPTPDDRRKRIEKRAKQIIEFLKSEQAVMRTERGQNADEYIKNLRDNDRC